MCGIVGLFDIRGKSEIDRQLLEKMNQTQVHRGPDEGEIYVEPGVGLGHRRLSIMDVASGQQPLFNEDGSVVVIFNGEIYNYRTLAKQLIEAGHQFKTHCDTEVIVHAWEEWGERCVDHFRGMFAFGVWDRNQEVLSSWRVIEWVSSRCIMPCSTRIDLFFHLNSKPFWHIRILTAK